MFTAERSIAVWPGTADYMFFCTLTARVLLAERCPMSRTISRCRLSSQEAPRGWAMTKIVSEYSNNYCNSKLYKYVSNWSTSF